MRRHLLAAVVIVLVTAGVMQDRRIRERIIHILRQESGHLSTTSLRARAVEIRTSSSTSEFVPGSHVTLTLEVLPRKGVHVYGPGAEGYIGLALTIDPQPFVRLLPTQYPPPEVRKLEWSEERVPLYSGPIALTLSIMIDDSPDARAMRQHTSDVKVTGTLKYQACDDKLCYEPVSMPVSWRLSL